MNDPKPHPVTLALQSLQAEDTQAAASLLPALYRELRRLARSLISRNSPGTTLQATALVHEAYIRLVPHGDPGWNSRGHFFGAAAKAMRRILVEQARRKKAAKHGGKMDRVDIEIDTLGKAGNQLDLLALDEALDELAVLGERKVEVVLLRYLTGLSIAETAAALAISESTVEADWRFARAFLFERLYGSEGGQDLLP